MSDVVTMGPPRRGLAWPAWLVIAGIVGFILFRSAMRPEGDASGWLVPLRLQGRYMVGAASLKLPGVSGKQVFKQSEESLDRGPYGQRLRVAVLAGELVGPPEARRLLARLETDWQGGLLTASEEALGVAKALDALYKGYETHGPGVVVLSSGKQDHLRQQLDWFGELALAPEGGDSEARAAVLGPARRTAIAALAFSFLFLAALGCGALVLGGLVVFAVCGRLKLAVTDDTGRGGIYAEMFALYLVVFIGLSWSLAQLPVRNEQGRLALTGAAMLGSLIVLGWPLLRGVSWRRVQSDLGLHGGDGAAKEVLAGIGCYLSALPLLALGLLVVFGLMVLQRRLGWGRDPFEPGAGPSHPIIGVATANSVVVWLEVFVLAAVLAPLVEEVLFRGALYRHLREAFGMRTRLSIVLAALASSFVFAVIHPQGWLGVPVLMALAGVFALTREWRGSLIAPMVAHGINNGVSLTALLTMAA